MLPKGKDFAAEQGSEKAAVAWRSEAEAREAQVKRQDAEIDRLNGVVERLGARLDAQALEISDLRVQRDELLSRPDYGTLLDRFVQVEAAVTATLTLLKAHDAMMLGRLESGAPLAPPLD